MSKEEKKKKGMPAWMKILIGILILLILLLLLFRPWGWFMNSGYEYNAYNYTPEIPEIPDYSGYAVPEIPDQPSQPETQTPEYKTSDKLSEITFTRNLHAVNEDQTTDVNMILKISGYIQEVPITVNLGTGVQTIDPDRETDRIYVFKDGKFEWDIYAKELEDDPEDGSCIITWTVEDKGEKIADADGTLSGMNGKITAAYNSWSDPNSPVMEITLKADISMQEIEDIRVSGENTICNGETSSTVKNKDYISRVTLPLIIRTDPLTNPNIVGNFQTEYDSFDDDGVAYMKYGTAGVPIDITFDDSDYWQVSYKVYVPQ